MKQFRNFLISGSLGQHFERPSLRITRSSQSRETMKKSSNPLGLASFDRVGKVVQFNSKKSAHFSEILNCPAGWSCPESAIPGIHICAPFHQLFHDGSMTSEGRVVQGCRSRLIPFVNEFRVTFKKACNLCEIRSLYSLDQLFQLTHRISPFL